MSFFFYKKVVPYVVFGLFCGISIIIWQNQIEHDRELLNRHTETSAEQIRIRLEGLMNARMASLELLAERWVERTPPDFSRERFIQFAEAFYSHYPGFFSINWINPEGVYRWGFPEKDMPDTGRSIYNSHFAETFRSIKQGSTHRTTPCADLESGGTGFHTLLPLIHKNRVQGYLDGVFQLDRLMGIALAEDILKDFRVLLYENDHLIFTNENPSERDPETGSLQISRTIQFPGKTWRLKLEPKKSTGISGHLSNLPFLIFGLFISITLSLSLYFLIQRMQLYREARDQALREIRERARAENKLLKKEKELESLFMEIAAKNEELETFVYTVSHDLKTPIVTIEGFIGAFREDFGEQISEEGDTYLNYISEATRKMEALINDLLELSRVGRLTEATTEFSLRDLVEDIIDTLQPLILEKGIGVTIDQNLPVIKGEKKRMVQVMENLISNAIKYIGKDNPGPKISIGVQEQNGRKAYYIRDNGIGIEPMYHEKIFQVFQRLPQAKKLDDGTGIGLTTAKRIIEHHGGHIWLESTPGIGSTFFFTIQDEEI